MNFRSRNYNRIHGRRTLAPSRFLRGAGARLLGVAALLKAVLLSATLLVGSPESSPAENIVIVQGPPMRPVTEAIQGFRKALEAGATHHGPKRVERVFFHDVSVANRDQAVETVQKVRAFQPDLVLAAGRVPIDVLQSLTDVPIVYALVAYPPAWAQRRSNVTGVGVTISPERWIEAIRAALPDRKRIGVLYDPRESGTFVGNALAAAGRQGVLLIAREVSSPKEVYDRLADLRGAVDVLWMIPDATVVRPQAVESLLFFSMRNQVPVVTFSEPYLEQGATLAILPDFDLAGRQAADLARRLLEAGGAASVPAELPKKLVVRTNAAVAKRLGVMVSPTRGGGDE